MTQHVKTCGTERFRLMPVLRYTTSAENDRLDAWLFIAEDPQHAADCLLDTIHHEAMQLLAHPEKGVRRPELANGIREWPTSTQRLLFTIRTTKGSSSRAWFTMTG